MKWTDPKPYVQDSLPTLEPVRHVALPIATCYRAVRMVGEYLKYTSDLTEADSSDLIHARNAIGHGVKLLEGVEIRRNERTDKGDH